MPGIARIARMPNLAVTLSSGFPYAGDSAGGVCISPRATTATIGAAATFLARIAFVARP